MMAPASAPLVDELAPFTPIDSIQVDGVRHIKIADDNALEQVSSVEERSKYDNAVQVTHGVEGSSSPGAGPDSPGPKLI